ncbi:Protein SPT2 like protein [Tupaia chinensis]|uniref:Protein SPT2 like protein n=1 Tax=Tupaia chinensis TaxID=246437 RepID=L9JAF3_TUPCH|nr:Protein SPT2 like protein [Tupaia chinensis]
MSGPGTPGRFVNGHQAWELGEQLSDLPQVLKDFPYQLVTKGRENMMMMMNMTLKWKSLLKMKENLRKKFPSTFEKSLAMTEKKYKDESDYALHYMESSWKEQQEEAKSLRLGMQEDLEEMKREEEMKRRKAKKLKRC